MVYDLMATTTVNDEVSLDALIGDLVDHEQVYCLANKTLYIKDGTEIVPITSNTFQFDTIADMQTASYLAVNDVVDLNGYYTVGDGANHKRVISVADDGSGVPVGNLFANLIYGTSINALSVGLKLNSEEDQVDILNKIIDISSTKQTKVIFPSGDYYFSEVNLIDKDGVNLEGALSSLEYTRTYFRTIGTSTNSLDAFVITEDTDSTSQRSLSIKNINFVESATSHRAIGVYWKHAIFGNVENITTTGFGEGVILHTIWNNVISNINCINYRIYGFSIKFQVNNCNLNNIHTTSTVTPAPLANFRLQHGNAVTLTNPTSEGSSPVHFKITPAFAFILISPHCEGGNTFIELESVPSVPSGAVTVQGGLFWSSPSTQDANSRFVKYSGANSGLEYLNLEGLRIRVSDDTTYVHDDYFSLDCVLNFTENVLFSNNITANYGSRKTRFKNIGDAMNPTYYSSRKGISKNITGGTVRSYSGQTNAYTHKTRVSGMDSVDYNNLLYIGDGEVTTASQRFIKVRCFQEYNNFPNENGYTEYNIGIGLSNNITVTDSITGSYVLEFSYDATTGYLGVRSNETYGNYNFIIEYMESEYSK